MNTLKKFAIFLLASGIVMTAAVSCGSDNSSKREKESSKGVEYYAAYSKLSRAESDAKFIKGDFDSALKDLEIMGVDTSKIEGWIYFDNSEAVNSDDPAEKLLYVVKTEYGIRDEMKECRAYISGGQCVAVGCSLEEGIWGTYPEYLFKAQEYENGATVTAEECMERLEENINEIKNGE